MADNSTVPLPPSAPLDTPTDHRSFLNVISWLFAIISFLVVATRCGTRWAVSRTFGLDDAFIIASLLLAIGSMVAVTIGIRSGLGLLDWESGSQSQLDGLQKAVYSFNFLFILSQFFSKLSILVFIRSLTPNRTHRNLDTFFIVLTVCWGITAGFGLIFQCDTPEVWNFLHGECISRLAFYTYVEILNIILDSVLVLLPIMVVWNLKLALKPKLMIVSCFIPRICVIAALIVQLEILYDEYQTGEPFVSWLFILSTLLAQCLGIVSACILYLKPFLQSLNSGMIRNDDLRRRGGETSFGSSYKRYASKTKTISKKKISGLLSTVTDNSLSGTNAKNETFPSTLQGIPLKDHPMRNDLGNDHQASVIAEAGVSEWEASSQSSQSNMIRHTRTFSATSTHTDEQV
ncbi:hypothetical protein EAF04_006536 [Stromatinia cepivora]|nr:hypothetical protein EAF04_006536 [Stromatinia cepivora]